MTTIDAREFRFLLHWLNLDDLLARERFTHAASDDVRAILELVEQLCDEEIAPHLRTSDAIEPQLRPDGTVAMPGEIVAGVRAIGDAGIFSIPFDLKIGGLQLPYTVYAVAMAILMGGNIAAASFMLLTVGNAGLLAKFGSPRQLAEFVAPQVSGVTMGTMCLSEPQAGSSLADIRTRAVADGEDELGARYRLAGAKMWISGGDHEVTENIVHLVLAKIPQADGTLPDGTAGISLFIAPKFLPDGQRNDIAVAGLNHKLGWRGLPNCALNFGEGAAEPDARAGTVGWLVGEPGQGLQQMFRMMNEARVAVGIGASMLAHRGYVLSLGYARERRQGRKPGVRGGEQVPIIDHADVRRMLLAQKAIAGGALALALYAATLIDEEATGTSPEARAAAGSRLALLTPVAKSWPSEFAQESLHHAIQIHGGAGYTRDFAVEQLYRDNRLNPIHEGTTGIQAMDLLGRKLRKEGRQSFAALHGDAEATIARASEVPGLADVAGMLKARWTALSDTMAVLLDASDEAAVAGLETTFLAAFGHATVAWLWLDRAVAAQTALSDRDEQFEAAFLRGQLHAARYFLLHELPRIDGWLAAISHGPGPIANIAADEF